MVCNFKSRDHWPLLFSRKRWCCFREFRPLFDKWSKSFFYLLSKQWNWIMCGFSKMGPQPTQPGFCLLYTSYKTYQIAADFSLKKKELEAWKCLLKSENKLKFMLMKKINFSSRACVWEGVHLSINNTVSWLSRLTFVRIHLGKQRSR